MLLAATGALAQQPSPLSRVGGTFYATAYGSWSARVISGNTTTGAGTSIIVSAPSGLNDGSTPPIQNLLSPVFLNPIKVNDNNSETVTPTAITIAPCPAGNVGVGGSQNCATITGTFNNTHGASAYVISGTFGLQEAINSAATSSNTYGGAVVVDSAWTAAGGTTAMLSAAIVQPDVIIEDLRGFAPQYWTPQGGATAIAAPAVLTAVTALPSATPVGAYGTGTYYMCVAYVDIMGQEGACSPTFSQAGLATGSFIFTAPAASTGAVGYTIYISLTSGTYQLAYKVPLVTQPTVIGSYPVSNGVCTLTTVETITPACSVANTVYGTSAATATVTAITVNTSPIDPQVTTVSTTSVYTPNAGGRTTYAYVPGSHFGTPGLVAASLPFTISAADTTTTPSVLGTLNIAPGLMNFVGRTIEVCGKATTTASTATIGSIQFQWDAFGQNTAGKGVQIGNLGLTPVTPFATTAVYTFCEQFMTTVASASATGGSINTIGGYINTSGVATAAAGQGAGSDSTIGEVGTLNLADDARLNVIYVHTNGTDGTALTLQDLTIKVLN
jgi:hypothetical protein